MAEPMQWRDGVTVVRAKAVNARLREPGSMGRATVFDFAGTGSEHTWIGRVSLRPSGNTGAHHHGRHEVMVYVIAGCTEIRWGDQLQFATEVATGDLAYFAPSVPHQERNLSDSESVEFLVVRSDNERIVVPLDVAAAEHFERVA